MRTLYLCLTGLTLLTVALLILERLRGAADREAQARASLRLLAEFHREYHAKKGVAVEDYQEQLAAFGKKHAGLEPLQRYLDHAGARSRGQDP